MKKFIFLAMFSIGMLTAAGQTTPIYVMNPPPTTSNGQGNSWGNAFDNLQDAIDLASITGQDIWVATSATPYSPTQFTDWGITFFINSNIAIYGGFTGTESSLGARDPNNRSILNGNNNRVLVIDDANVTLDGFIIQNGTGFGGGGINHISGNLTINNVIIQNNNATWGGGIRSNAGNLTITHSQIINNGSSSCTGGGGLYIGTSNMFITNTLIADNEATSGGGIYMDASLYSSIFEHVTIAENNASFGSAIYSTSNNSIIRPNHTIIKGDIIHSGTFTPAYSLIEGITSTSPYSNNLDGSINPLFVNSDGGNYRLKYNSPCVNAGSTSGIGTDLDGNPRLCGSNTDMGAYEYQTGPDANGIVYVKYGSSGNGSSFDDAFGELSDALYYAQTNSSISQIWVTEGTYIPLYAANGSSTNSKDRAFVLQGNIAIYGGFSANSNSNTTITDRDWLAYPTVLSGWLHDQSVSAYHVVIAVNGGICLDGFHISEGNANGTGTISVANHSISRANGAGIYVNSSITLQNLIIEDNTASNCGGGVYNCANITAVDITIMNNMANLGGGLYNNGGHLTMDDSRICGNKAYSQGSGLQNMEESYIDLQNVLIAQNEILEDEGGSIYNKQTCGYLRHVTIAMNIPQGIGIYNIDASNIEIFNSIVWTDPIQTGDHHSIHNEATIQADYCLLQGMSMGGNNLDPNASPDFVNPIYHSDYFNNPGDYHLLSNSQCINFGNSSYTMSANDLDGNTRIHENPDLGVYEMINEDYENKPFHKSTENNSIFQQENIILSNLTLRIYPNPSSSGQETKLFLGENNFYYDNPVQVKLYSLDGKQLHNRKYPNGNITLNLPQLPAGMYLINAQTQEGAKYTTKLVVTQ